MADGSLNNQTLGSHCMDTISAPESRHNHVNGIVWQIGSLGLRCLILGVSDLSRTSVCYLICVLSLWFRVMEGLDPMIVVMARIMVRSILVWLTCQSPAVGVLIVCVSVCPMTCRHLARLMVNGWLWNFACMSGTMMPTMCQLLVVTKWPN